MLLSTSELGTLVHVPTVCTECSICELMCSLYHEGVQAPPLTRLQVVNTPFTSAKARLRLQSSRRKEGKRVALQCDLRRGKEAGTICVEYCPARASGFTPSHRINQDNDIDLVIV